MLWRFSLMSRYIFLCFVIGLGVLGAISVIIFNQYTFITYQQAKSIAEAVSSFLKQEGNPQKIFSSFTIYENLKSNFSVRVISEQYISPDWESNAFEKKISQLLKSKKIEEYGEWEKFTLFGISRYRYVKSIKVNPELSEIISVTIHTSFLDFVSNLFKLTTKNRLFWIAIWIILMSMVANSMMVYWMIKRIIFLRNAARSMSIGRLDIDLGLKGVDERKVKDEVVQVAMALEKLKCSIKALRFLLERYKTRVK